VGQKKSSRQATPSVQKNATKCTIVLKVSISLSILIQENEKAPLVLGNKK